jgi:phosphinothricin acetyltransferase
VNREVADADLGEVARIHSHYVEHTVATFDLEPLGEGGWREKWRAAGEAGHPWLVCEEDGRVLGFAIAGPFRPKAAYGPTVETTIYLDPAAVGRGVGRALYSDMLREASQRGFHLAVAGVTLPNEASARLHAGVGFERVGIFNEVGHKHGEWRDVEWWQLRL